MGNIDFSSNTSRQISVRMTRFSNGRLMTKDRFQFNAFDIIVVKLYSNSDRYTYSETHEQTYILLYVRTISKYTCPWYVIDCSKQDDTIGTCGRVT